jgi:hypothetical protein
MARRVIGVLVVFCFAASSPAAPAGGARGRSAAAHDCVHERLRLQRERRGGASFEERHLPDEQRRLRRASSDRDVPGERVCLVARRRQIAFVSQGDGRPELSVMDLPSAGYDELNIKSDNTPMVAAT